MGSILINLVLFKAGWLACVLGAANGLPWLGIVVVPVIVAIHLVRMPDPRVEAGLIAAAGAIGLVWESVLVSSGLLHYSSGVIFAGLAPLWIVAMWLLLGTTLNLAMRWLKDRLLLAALVGAIAGPAAFVAGERLGAVTFPHPFATLIALAVGWGVLLPVLVILAMRTDDLEPVGAQ